MLTPSEHKQIQRVVICALANLFLFFLFTPGFGFLTGRNGYNMTLCYVLAFLLFLPVSWLLLIRKEGCHPKFMVCSLFVQYLFLPLVLPLTPVLLHLTDEQNDAFRAIAAFFPAFLTLLQTLALFLIRLFPWPFAKKQVLPEEKEVS